MRPETREKYHAYMANQAHINGVPNTTESFAVNPTVQQKIESKIQESNAFLQRINVVPVDELQGQKIGLGVSGTIAGRTDVTAHDRTPRDVHALDSHDYKCEATHFDTAITWALLDAWAKFPDFQNRLRNSIITREGLDRLMIGFNGTRAAKQTERDKNPLLQDVNKGWLQQYREHSPKRVLRNMTVGSKNPYANLDALVFDAVNELIEPWYRDDSRLVAIMGRGLLSDKYFPLINKYDQPSERLSADLIISQKRVGGLQAVQAPFIPDSTVLITALENLSLYYQIGARRSYVIDNPKRSRIENYDSSNDAYVVEDYGFGCLLEGITLTEKSPAINTEQKQAHT